LIDVRAAGNPDIQLHAGFKHAKAVVKLADLKFSGVMRVSLGPFCNQWPCFTAVWAAVLLAC